MCLLTPEPPRRVDPSPARDCHQAIEQIIMRSGRPCILTAADIVRSGMLPVVRRGFKDRHHFFLKCAMVTSSAVTELCCEGIRDIVE